MGGKGCRERDSEENMELKDETYHLMNEHVWSEHVSWMSVQPSI